MSKAKTEANKTRVFILKEQDAKIRFSMKSKRHPVIIAKAGEFLFDEDDTKITLLRCEETLFPNDIEGKQMQHVVYLKDINQVDRWTK
ncbi:MAG: hypothetical protein KDD41_09770 [Flavobacteriales bacterium]|nr:hypothetical protein [Flavobacteriales bacterium]